MSIITPPQTGHPGWGVGFGSEVLEGEVLEGEALGGGALGGGADMIAGTPNPSAWMRRKQCVTREPRAFAAGDRFVFGRYSSCRPKNKVHGAHDAHRRPHVIELQRLLHVEDRERHEDT